MNRFCLLIVAALAGLGVARADAQTSADWLGRYAPISSACKGLALIVVPGKLSFGECSRVGFKDLTTAAGFAGRLDEAAACPLAGKVLTLTPDGSDANTLSIYDDERAWQDQRPNLVCAYSR